MWYLGSEMAPISLFSSKISDDEKRCSPERYPIPETARINSSQPKTIIFCELSMSSDEEQRNRMLSKKIRVGQKQNKHRSLSQSIQRILPKRKLIHVTSTCQ